MVGCAVRWAQAATGQPPQGGRMLSSCKLLCYSPPSQTGRIEPCRWAATKSPWHNRAKKPGELWDSCWDHPFHRAQHQEAKDGDCDGGQHSSFLMSQSTSLSLVLVAQGDLEQAGSRQAKANGCCPFGGMPKRLFAEPRTGPLSLAGKGSG